MTVRLQREPFDVTAEVAALTQGRTDIGAVVTFTGICRGSEDGAPITALTLEHYPEMAEAEIARHVDEAKRRWAIEGVTVIHRYGRITPGEDIVMVVTASSHRQDAFAAAEFLMDFLKTRAPFCAVGDIGTHAFHLAEFVTGLRVSQLAAELSAQVAGRKLDDNAQMLLRFPNGARGGLWVSQVAAGNENGLRLRIYGAKGGLEWSQEEPNHLRHAPYGQQPRVIARGGPGATPLAASAARIPSGHPEGYLEAFAQVYRDIADLIAAYDAKTPPQAGALLVPTAKDGLRGVQFVHAAVESSRRNAAWVDLN
jgi:molybdopterin synthase catalytic subunit